MLGKRSANHHGFISGRLVFSCGESLCCMSTLDCSPRMLVTVLLTHLVSVSEVCVYCCMNRFSMWPIFSLIHILDFKNKKHG